MSTQIAMPRGLRNNNPGNIRTSSTRYMGEVQPSQDKSFKQFETMAWGYRAVFALLHSYHKRQGLRTLRQMLNRYAPPVENDTEGYIKQVARNAGVDPDTPIDVLDRDTMIPVVSAICNVENGVKAVPCDVCDGWDLFMKYQP